MVQDDSAYVPENRGSTQNCSIKTTRLGERGKARDDMLNCVPVSHGKEGGSNSAGTVLQVLLAQEAKALQCVGGYHCGGGIACHWIPHKELNFAGGSKGWNGSFCEAQKCGRKLEIYCQKDMGQNIPVN